MCGLHFVTTNKITALVYGCKPLLLSCGQHVFRVKFPINSDLHLLTLADFWLDNTCRTERLI